MASHQPIRTLQLSRVEELSEIVTAVTAGIMIGFLCVGATAKAIDKIESARCPQALRVTVNGGTVLKEWAEWRQCPKQP